MTTTRLSSLSLSPASLTPLNDQEALAMVEIVGPRIYQITGIENELHFIAYGCAGSNSTSQMQTAALINELHQQYQFPFILNLGDTIYDYGVNAPEHPHFDTFFYKKYPSKPASFMTIGNHDSNQHLKSRISNNPPGRATSINQVAHTYRRYNYSALFQQTAIHFQHLPRWCMPYYFYAIDINKLRIIVCDTNSYVQDYYELYSQPEQDHSRNQAFWVQQAYQDAKAKGMSVMLAGHHPHLTDGKRAFEEKFDSTHYISQEVLNNVTDKLGLNTFSYNEILSSIFKAQGITEISCIIAAHDHFLSYHKSEHLCQVTSGGGGGTLQSRETYANHPQTACHIKKNGVSMISINTKAPKKFTIEFYTTDQLHLRYENQHNKAITTKDLHLATDKLRQCLRHACNQYFNQLKKNEAKAAPSDKRNYNGSFASKVKWVSTATVNFFKHDHKLALEAGIAQEIDTYFQQYQLPELSECLDFIQKTLIPVSQSLLSSTINQSIKNKFKKSLEELVAENSVEEKSKMSLTR